MTKDDFKKLEIPDNSGVYFFRDKAGEILYIGKATSLRERLKSYFSPDLIKTRGPHLVDMVWKAERISWATVENALEALVLEASEIRKWKPYYNTKEKDDKSYNCVVITREEFPRLLLVREKDIDRTRKVARVKNSRTAIAYDTVYGPFPSGSAIREGLKILRRIFPFRDMASAQKDREVFYHQIGLSPDTRSGEAMNEYKKTIRNIKLFLGAKFSELRTSIARDMNAAAKKMHFEEAEIYKRKLFALDHIQDVSLMKRDIVATSGGARIESYDVAHISGTSMVGVMCVMEGERPNKNEYRKFIIRSVKSSNDPAALREMLERRLKHDEWPMPILIVVDGNIIQKNLAEKVLKEHSLKIPVVAVTKDERHRPKAFIGPKILVEKYKLGILHANAEAHRFSLSFHREKRRKKSILL